MSELKYIDTTFSSNNFERVNDEFLKVTISVMSCDQVANWTKFTKESVEEAKSTLNFAPVIGYFNGEDFEGHGIEYIITDNGFEEKVKTLPFGVVIKDSARWSNVTKENGENEEYLVVDAYLWSRYSEPIKKVKDNKCNQSMEVVCHEGNYRDDYYEVTKFSFSGLCILGENVTPAFNLAKVRTSDKFNKDEFKADYQEMMFALDRYFENVEGGKDLEENIVCSEEQNEEIIEEVTLSKIEEEAEEVEMEAEAVIEDKVVEEEEVEMETEEVSEDYQAKYEEVLNELSELKATYVDLLSEYDNMVDKYSELEAEVVSLREFKAEKDKEALDVHLEEVVFSKFAELKGIEGYEEIFNARYEMTEEELIRSLKVLAYDNNITIKKGKKANYTKQSIQVPIPLHSESEKECEAVKRYGKGIEKYLKNNK